MAIQKNLKVDTRVIHAYRGRGVYTATCAYLDKLDSDKHTIHIYFDDRVEINKVSTSLVTLDLVKPGPILLGSQS